MVRLEMDTETQYNRFVQAFTFQYGQIRNYTVCSSPPSPSAFTFQYGQIRNILFNQFVTSFFVFTFQYGQIRNDYEIKYKYKDSKIYIPVWLDQKSKRRIGGDLQHYYLHSSMVRLEINLTIKNTYSNKRFTFQYGQIRNIKTY